EAGSDILGLLDFERRDFEAERAGQLLNLALHQEGSGSTDIGHDRQPAEAGQNLAQQLKSLASNVGLLKREAGGIAAWSRQTRDEAGTERVRDRENDRYDRCSLLGREDRCRRVRDDDIDIESDQLSHDLAEAFGATLCPAILEHDGTPLDPAE